MPDQEPTIVGDGSVPAPVEPQAQADAPVTMSALKDLLGSFKTEIVTEAKNGINADLRRAGVFKKQEPVEHPNPTPAPQKLPGAPSSAAGLSLADVEAMLERERVITARATKHDLNDAQIRRMKAALSGVAADQFAIEADAFLNDLGLVKAPAPQPATVNTPSPDRPAAHTQPPVSDKGSPSPGQYTPNWKLELGQIPIGMSPAARTAMDAELGVEKARKMRLEAGRVQAERIRVTPKG